MPPTAESHQGATLGSQAGSLSKKLFAHHNLHNLWGEQTFVLPYETTLKTQRGLLQICSATAKWWLVTRRSDSPGARWPVWPESRQPAEKTSVEDPGPGRRRDSVKRWETSLTHFAKDLQHSRIYSEPLSWMTRICGMLGGIFSFPKLLNLLTSQKLSSL